jgi:hypothetical protein
MDDRAPRGVLDALKIDLGVEESDVLGDGAGEQLIVLKTEATCSR